MKNFQANYIATKDIWQIYQMIIDIEKYPEFVPWCSKITVIEQQQNIIISDNKIKFGPFCKTYRSTTIIKTPSEDDITQDLTALIEVKSNDPLFKHLYTKWFLQSHQENKTRVSFYIEFEFANSIYKKIATNFFSLASMKMTKAFQQREKEI